MDIFRYRDDLIGDYSAYVKGFLEVHDPEVEKFITSHLDGGVLWPEPLVQLNPAFVQGPTIDDLVDQKRLHATCREIFRRGKTVEHPQGAPLRLHRHQEKAIECAQKGVNYVLTTGTGSGKSLAYLIPIIDHVLKTGSGHGIKAIVVYPMNALANSQLGEMEKFLGPGFPTDNPPVRFARYTGQENEEARDAILNNPPDVLLTNYVMLELILTRPREREHLIKAAGDLKFLVLDELHTYRGRQGADVSMLVRRLRETLKAEDVICVGTSATMGTGATFEDIRRDVADVAKRLFGSPVSEDHFIAERLRRITPDVQVDDPRIAEQLSVRVMDASYQIPSSFDAFCVDPLASWVETTFGLEKEEGTEYLKRATPKTIRQAGKQLSDKLGLDEAALRRRLEFRQFLIQVLGDQVPERQIHPFSECGGVERRHLALHRLANLVLRRVFRRVESLDLLSSLPVLIGVIKPELPGKPLRTSYFAHTALLITLSFELHNGHSVRFHCWSIVSAGF